MRIHARTRAQAAKGERFSFHASLTQLEVAHGRFAARRRRTVKLRPVESLGKAGSRRSTRRGCLRDLGHKRGTSGSSNESGIPAEAE